MLGSGFGVGNGNEWKGAVGVVVGLKGDFELMVGL